MASNLAPWRVVVIEDDASTRADLSANVQRCAGADLAASFELLEPASHWFASHSADLLLTDLALPDGHALPLIRQVKAQHPRCEVVVVSVFGDEATVYACIEAGAIGYLHKDASLADIASAIELVRSGGSPISPMIARKVLSRMQRPAALNQPSTQPSTQPPAQLPVRGVNSTAAALLTPREAEVLQLIAKGFSYAETAQHLGVSLATIQSHVRGIYGKLEVHSRGEAVFEAAARGLIDGLHA
jgi:DNA-binding NarL/FixJ family response regulator